MTIRMIRDDIYDAQDKLEQFANDFEAYHKFLSEQAMAVGDHQDAEIMKTAAEEVIKSRDQLKKAITWVAFINEFGPKSDV